MAGLQFGETSQKGIVKDVWVCTNLLELLDGTLVDTAALVDEMASLR